MKKIIILVIVLVLLAALLGGLAYADLYLRRMVQAHAEAQITRTLPQVKGVHVTLDGFPFTPRVLLSGEVEALHVQVEEAEDRGLRATGLRLDVHDIVLDKDALLDERRLVVTDIGTARVEGFVDDDAVSKVAGHEVVFEPGKARVKYKGKTIEAKARVDGRLVMLASNLPGVPPMVFPLPPSELIPCSPELELLAGKLRLSCSVDELPAKLREAMAAQ